MLARDRRPFQQFLALDDDAAIQALLAGVDARQHQCDGEELEGAAHREALVEAVSGQFAGGGVQHRDAQPPTHRRLDLAPAPNLDWPQIFQGWLADPERPRDRPGARQREGHPSEMPSVHLLFPR